MAVNYWDKAIYDGNGYVPFYVRPVRQKSGYFELIQSYYNPTWEIGRDFSWWRNIDCSTDPYSSWCQRPDDVNELEALIYDTKEKQWYWCKSIKDAADRSNWVSLKDSIGKHGFLATPKDYQKASKEGTPGPGGKGKPGSGQYAPTRSTDDTDPQYSDSERDAPWFNLIKSPGLSKFLNKVFGKPTPQKEKRILFIAAGLFAGKVLSDKKKK